MANNIFCFCQLTFRKRNFFGDKTVTFLHVCISVKLEKLLHLHQVFKEKQIGSNHGCGSERLSAALMLNDGHSSPER